MSYKSTAKKIVYFLLVLLFLTICIVFILVKNTQTRAEGTYSLAGLENQVEVFRDSHGVPHIVSNKSDLDVFFALGFIHAQDRFWQMEFQRHVAAGSLSELFGAGLIDKDKYLRSWEFYYSATKAWASYDDATKEIITRYTQGVNAFIALGHLPLQFKIVGYKPKPWTVIDSICWQKIMAWSLENSWKKKLVNSRIANEKDVSEIDILQPPYPASAPITLAENNTFTTLSRQQKEIPNSLLMGEAGIVPSKLQGEDIRESLGFNDMPGKGSNAWVVSGKWTASHKPLLANDTHLELTSPVQWYLVELQGPHLHVSGATIPGIPAVVIGHNNTIAWGMTNVNANTEDLYIEPENVKIMSRYERILVKNASPVEYSVRWSAHGPILSDVEPELKYLGNTVALKWTAFMAHDTTIESFIKLDYAQNWEEFKNALKYYVAPVQNFVYADMQGNIGYFMPGAIPIREGWDGDFPVQKNENKEWSCFIPFKMLPQTLNPKTGLIVTANNKAISDNYPYKITFRWETPPYRAKRINELLKSKIKNHLLLRKDMADVQLDVLSILWFDIKLQLLKTVPIDDQSLKALEILKQWDGQMTTDSVAATIFAFWNAELNTLIPENISKINHRPEPLFIIQQLKENGVYCQVKYRSCSEFLSTSLQQALIKLSTQYGNNSHKWQWGRIHYATFKALGFGDIAIVKELVNKKIPTPGGYNTVNVGTYNDKFQQIDGAIYREIIDLSALDSSEFIEPLGQTEAPFSAHRYDLLVTWAQGGYINLANQPYNKTLILEPG